MKTLILEGIFVYKDLEKCFDGKTSLELIIENSKKNNFDRLILLQNGNIKTIPEGVKNVILKEFTPFSILSAILEESKNTDDVVIYDAGCPFYDPQFIEEMIKRHQKYFADYTYSIGYPDGLSPTILHKDVIKEMIKLVENEEEIKKDYLFYTLSKDINSFDIETFLSDFDCRIYRLKFGINDEGEEIFTKQTFSIFKNDFTIEKITKYYFNNPKEFYTIPYMLNLELNNSSSIKSIYYPQAKESKNEIDLELAKKIIREFKKINNQFYLVLGGLGEPLEYKDIINLLNFISDEKINCVIETTGVIINNEFIKEINNLNKENIIFVVKLDCYDEQTYKIIHPDGNFGEIKNAINILKETGFKVYKQIVRMHENEVEIEKYIRNKQSDDLIIRKYSTYCQTLPDKKVVDLAPLDRIPCYHLRREINVKSDGSVTYCMYSIETKIGDITKDNIFQIIEKLKKAYQENADKNYKDFCKNCDDYYLFNF